ncbi:hypothetical protein [Flavobacterium sp. UBA6046]|jgi:hypothetical protein|uniref:hypothetical protein n=1 Tax=Flavobacterium sp. UBA6046 TaxID=1946552 RepID=UPI0025BF2061|nr:hypothetical protein [Flavobacterium sp. UBA6046]
MSRSVISGIEEHKNLMSIQQIEILGELDIYEIIQLKIKKKYKQALKLQLLVNYLQ